MAPPPVHFAAGRLGRWGATYVVVLTAAIYILLIAALMRIAASIAAPAAAAARVALARSGGRGPPGAGPQVLVVVLHVTSWERLREANGTWLSDLQAAAARRAAGRDVRVFAFTFSKWLSGPAIACAHPRVPAGSPQQYDLTRSCLAEALAAHPDARWLLKADDDTWVHGEHLLDLVDEIEAAAAAAAAAAGGASGAGDRDADVSLRAAAAVAAARRGRLWPAEPSAAANVSAFRAGAAAVFDLPPGLRVYAGYPLRADEGTIFASGGAGILLSAAAAAAVTGPPCAPLASPLPQFEDVSIGACLARAGVPLLDPIGFFPHSPEALLAWTDRDSSDHVRPEPPDFTQRPWLTWHYVSGRLQALSQAAAAAALAEAADSGAAAAGRAADPSANLERAARNATAVPLILHQIWVGRRPIPAETARLMQRCRALHPSWEHHLWTDDSLRAEAARSRGTAGGPSAPGPLAVAPGPLPGLSRPQFEAAEEAIMKADILRYELLYRFGGVYLDADSACLRPLDALLAAHAAAAPPRPCFAANESEVHRPGLVANGVLGCAPGARPMLAMLRALKRKPLGGAPWQVTGPLFLTQHLLEHGGRRDFLILPSATFFPLHFEDLRGSGAGRARARAALPGRLDRAFTLQLWGTTRSDPDGGFDAADHDGAPGGPPAAGTGRPAKASDRESESPAAEGAAAAAAAAPEAELKDPEALVAASLQRWPKAPQGYDRPEVGQARLA